MRKKKQPDYLYTLTVKIEQWTYEAIMEVYDRKNKRKTVEDIVRDLIIKGLKEETE